MNRPHQERWYAAGLRFECQRCGACCTGEPGYVWVTPVEAERIADLLGISNREFAANYLRKAGSHDSLIELPDGRCIFYSAEGCTIYAVRPTQCRTFPFWQSILATPEAWGRCRKRCPGMDQGRLFSAEEIEEMVRLSAAGRLGPKFYRR